MGNLSILQKWAVSILGIVSAYDVLINQFVPADIREEYYLYSLGLSWEIWAIILLILLVAVYWGNNGNQASEEKPVTTKKSNSTGDGGIAMQNVRESPVIKDSFNTTMIQQPVGYEMPTKQQIIRRIAVDIQEIEERFDYLRHSRLSERIVEFGKLKESFEIIRRGVLRQAKIELKGSEILNMFELLERLINKYPYQIGRAIDLLEQKNIYLKSDKGNLPSVLEQIDYNAREMEKTEAGIVLLIQQLKNFEHDSKWYTIG